jgi:hypothetical protein
MWCRAISGDGGSGTTGAAVSGADARLGRRCQYGVPETSLADSRSQSIRTLSLLDLGESVEAEPSLKLGTPVTVHPCVCASRLIQMRLSSGGLCAQPRQCDLPTALSTTSTP